MKEEQVVVADMLLCRERRVQIQEMLRRQYHCPVISFCMNIPGPVKTTPEIRTAFESGMDALLSSLKKEGGLVNTSYEFHEKTGDELILSVSFPAEKLKKLTVSIEENHRFGRLFDMDVIGLDGQKLSRKTYRKCIVCGRQAQECARARAHSVSEMQEKIRQILRQSRETACETEAASCPPVS